jgi:tight adherence protein B
MTLGFLVFLVFVVATAVIGGLAMVIAGRSQAVREKRLEHRLNEVSGGIDEDLPASSLVREQTKGNLLKGSGIERWIEQSGTSMSVSTVLMMSLIMGVAGAVVAFLLSHMAILMPVGFLVGLCLPLMVLKRKRSKRMNKFEEHFPEALDLLSRGIRAGHAFSAGMKMVADELGDPVGPEFRKAFDEQNFGLPLKESLDNLCFRIPLLDVRFFSTAVLIQRETGGNLSEILDNLASVVRERFKIHRQVRVHTAHGRFTGWVLMALPAFLALALTFINPDHMKLLFENKMGQMMIAGSIVMQAIGYFWIRQVIKIEV